MKNKITSLMILIILLLFTPRLHNKVSAEEYEKNILISCESKEIDINDIPENREVELNVSIENNPGFIALGMYVKYDLRLGIDNYRMCKEVEGADGIVYKPNSSFAEGEDGFSRVRIFTKNNDLSKNDEIVTTFKFIIPSSAKIGDVYEVEFIDKSEYTTFFFLPNDNEMYKEEYFPKHIDGAIRIVGNTEESDNNEVSIPNEEINKPDLEISHETEKAITEAPKEPAEDTITKVTESTTVVTTNLTEQTSKTSVPEIMVITSNETSSSTEASTLVESTSSTSQNSTSVTEKTEHDEVNKRSYIIPVALVAVILAVSAALTVNRQRRSK